jgi:4-amino-4-deoxy-L-arabinose transferase-like glycosyltransferase
MLSRLRLPVFLSILFLVALAIRVGAVVVLRDMHAGPSPQFGADPVEFDALAHHLAAGDGYVNDRGAATAFRAPGFPLFLAGIYTAFGTHYPLVYVLLCAMGAASCVLTYFVARELLPESPARLAAVLATIYFPHIYFSTLLLSENLFVLLLAATLWLLLRYLRARHLSLIIGGGLCLGACVLVRPFALLLLPILMLVVLLHASRDRRAGITAMATLFISTALVVAPWTIRNHHVFGRPVLVATNGGSTFYGGNNDIVAAPTKSIGTWVSTRRLPGRDTIDAMPDEVAHDKIEWQFGRTWLAEHPARASTLMAAKAARLALPDVDSANRKYVLLNLIGYTPYMLLIIHGLYRCTRRHELRSLPWQVIHGTLLATLLTALIFWGSPRFRDANLPVLMIYAALGLSRGSNLAADRDATQA